jgi:hypothetical protein
MRIVTIIMMMMDTMISDQLTSTITNITVRTLVASIWWSIDGRNYGDNDDDDENEDKYDHDNRDCD